MGFHMDNSTLVKYEGDDTGVVIPDGVTSIGDRAFSECTRLTSVIIPEGVTNIGEYAFSKCAGLKSITIPESVTSIDAWAFSECTGLTDMTIPESVTRYRNTSLCAFGAIQHCERKRTTSLRLAATPLFTNARNYGIMIIANQIGRSGTINGTINMKTIEWFSP